MNTIRSRQIVSIILVTGTVWGMLFLPAQAAADATYTVNSLNDANDGACNATHCSLREAMNAANSTAATDIIRFGLSGTINLGSMLPGVVRTGGELTIDGTGRAIIIRGQGWPAGDRVFYIQTRANLTLRDLTVQNGYTTTEGGAVYNSGTLVIEDCTFSGNQADNQGGAIYTMSSLNVTDSTFSHNSTNVNNGGAIYIHNANVVISGGVFQENTATFSGGAIYNGKDSDGFGGDLTVTGANFFLNYAMGGHGGAIGNQSDLIMDGVTIALNSAEEKGGGFYNALGGHYKIENSAFNYNTSQFSHGGGIFAEYPGSDCYIEDSTISRNEAHLDGGGFYVDQGQAIFRRTLIAHNIAGRDGGGGFGDEANLYLLNDAFEANEAVQNGGGYCGMGDFTIHSSTFSDNSAGWSGGGMYYGEAAEIGSMDNSTFYANSAFQGGGLTILTPSYIRNCTIVANSASPDGGGGIYSEHGVYVGNTILANNTNGNCRARGIYVSNLGNNIDSGVTCNFDLVALKGSLISTNPRLGPLQDNGGNTSTMLPDLESPAIDAVIYEAPNDCPAVDQRGYTRPFGDFCDIGAVEWVQHQPTLLPLVVRP